MNDVKEFIKEHKEEVIAATSIIAGFLLGRRSRFSTKALNAASELSYNLGHSDGYAECAKDLFKNSVTNINIESE